MKHKIEVEDIRDSIVLIQGLLIQIEKKLVEIEDESN